MSLPIPGSLYRLKKDVILFREESVFSKSINGQAFGGGSIVMFVEMSPVIQRVAAITRTEDLKYRFMKLIMGDIIGWCPFLAISNNMGLSTTANQWEILEPLEEVKLNEFCCVNFQ